jgi:hypothetical protein
MRLLTSSRAVPTVTAVILLVLTAGACGSSSGEATTAKTSVTAPKQPASEYVQVLGEMRSTAEEGGSYDGYGFAEYFPKPQRAALDAFCFVVDHTLESGDNNRLAETTGLTAQIVSKAEADLKAELNIVAPAPTHRAIQELDATLDLGSLDAELAEGYVHACYR